MRLKRILVYFIVAALVTGLTGGCVYFNTFYNARKSFNSAEQKRSKSRRGVTGGTGDYNKAIEKALKVVENHPNSKYYDDALYILAVSYFFTKQHGKAERRFREILANYGESEYAKDSYLYLAQAKLRQNDINDAMDIFEEIFDGDYDKKFRSQAAVALGNFHFDEGEYDRASSFFLAVRDSLGTKEEARDAQMQIADGQFIQFRFPDALSAYLQVLGMDPTRDEEYHALFQAAVSSFRIQKISQGIDYLQTMIADEMYFDSINILKLSLAEGYEYDDELETAEQIYKEVAVDETKRLHSSLANYRLGLIYQYDYDDLIEAKKYYDKTIQLNRATDAGRDALQRSSDIGKLEKFARNIRIDSTTTQENIDDAAHTQYQLAELYYFQLNKPDTAMLEMQYLIDTFATAYEAPKAMIALAEMNRDHRGDTAVADSILRETLVRYAGSDYLAEAITALGLNGTEADTGYAEIYIRKAEDFLIDDENLDSARYYYQHVVDKYPDSKYNLQSQFSLIWMTEEYESPGDSSVIFAYHALADSFPGSTWGSAAKLRTKYRPKRKAASPESEPGDTSGTGGGVSDDLPLGLAGEGDSSRYIDPLEEAHIGPVGDKLKKLASSVRVLETRTPFEYPPEAYRDAFEGDLYFQILLDFSGQVADYVLKIGSGNDEIDRRATEAVATKTFDAARIPLEFRDNWWVYRFRVVLPSHLR